MSEEHDPGADFDNDLGLDRAITTPRLRLTPLRVDDAAEMTAVLADPALYSFTGGGPPSEDELRARYAFQAGGWSPAGDEEWRNWIVRLRGAAATTDGAAIGFVQATITDAGATADVAWVIGITWQGHGYASEAGRALVGWLRDRGIREITAHVHPAHVASERVARSIGLEPTDDTEDDERIWRLQPG